VLLVLGGLLAWLVVRPVGEDAGGLGGEPLGGAPGSANGVAPLDPAAAAAAKGTQPGGTPAPGSNSPGADAAGARKWIHVVDAAGGRALGGAALYIGWAPEGHPALGEHHRVAVADAEGRIPFGRSVLLQWYTTSPVRPRGKRGGLQLLAVVPGYGTSDWTAVPSIDAIPEVTTLTVASGSALFGEVRDAVSGRPVAEARLQIEVAQGGTWRAWSEPFVSDGGGAYRVAGLPPQRALRAVVLPSVRAEPLSTRLDRQEHPAWDLKDGVAAKLSSAGGEVRLDVDTYGHGVVRGFFTVAVEGGGPLPKSVTVTHGYRFERPNPGARFAGTITSSSGTHRATITYGPRTITTQREYDRPIELDPAAPQFELFLPAGDNHVVVRTEPMRSARSIGREPSAPRGRRCAPPFCCGGGPPWRSSSWTPGESRCHAPAWRSRWRTTAPSPTGRRRGGSSTSLPPTRRGEPTSRC
jgi:hypothetical protein